MSQPESSDPKNRKEQSRQKIVETAAKAFNQHGVDGIGIADIMKQAGLTQEPSAIIFPRKKSSSERHSMTDSIKPLLCPRSRAENLLTRLFAVILAPSIATTFGMLSFQAFDARMNRRRRQSEPFTNRSMSNAGSGGC